MEGPVSTGSAGGADPPHGHPSRLPSHCETETSNFDRSKRSIATCRDIAKRIKQLGGRIPLKWDGVFKTYHAVGKDASLFASAVGMLVRRTCDPGYPNWRSLPDEQKITILRHLLEWFIIDYNNGWIKASVERSGMNAYKGFKNRLASHFKDNGGMEDIQRARRAPLPDICNNQDRWESFINQYTRESKQNQSMKNAENRSKHKFPSTQGRKSMAERRFYGVEDPDTEPPSKTTIEVFKEVHQHKDGTWVNDFAHSTHDEMGMHSTQLSQGASSSGTAAALSPMDQIEVMARVFRPGRGYIPGVGPWLPSSSLPTPTPSSPFGQSSSSHTISEDEHNRRIEEIVTQQLNERLQHLIPILQKSVSTPISDDILTHLVPPRCEDGANSGNSYDVGSNSGNS